MLLLVLFREAGVCKGCGGLGDGRWGAAVDCRWCGRQDCVDGGYLGGSQQRGVEEKVEFL